MSRWIVLALTALLARCHHRSSDMPRAQPRATSDTARIPAGDATVERDAQHRPPAEPPAWSSVALPPDAVVEHVCSLGGRRWIAPRCPSDASTLSCVRARRDGHEHAICAQHLDLGEGITIHSAERLFDGQPIARPPLFGAAALTAPAPNLPRELVDAAPGPLPTAAVEQRRWFELLWLASTYSYGRARQDAPRAAAALGPVIDEPSRFVRARFFASITDASSAAACWYWTRFELRMDSLGRPHPRAQTVVLDSSMTRRCARVLRSSSANRSATTPRAHRPTTSVTNPSTSSSRKYTWKKSPFTVSARP